MQSPIIGILGGMWPYASLRCYQLFLESSRQHSWGRSNHDFPHIIIDSIPVRDLTDDLTSLESTIIQVRDEYLRLRSSGATIMLMACNTMHLYLDRIYDQTSDVSHISLIDTMSQFLIEKRYKHVGILWSLNTTRSGLYHRALIGRWIIPISLEDDSLLKWINTIIAKTISGEEIDIEDRETMERSVDGLIRDWAECIILGCTELPIAFDGFRAPIPLYDPLQIAVDQACRLYYLR